MSEIKISEQIAFLRHQKGITQEVLARKLGVTNQTVSKWEAGQCFPDMMFLPELADYFEVSIDDLLGHTEKKSLESLCLSLKKYFTDLPEEKCFDNVWCLAAQLHEIMVSKGYKRYLPWEEKNYSKDAMKLWDMSACSEAEGNALRAKDLILYTNNQAWTKPRKFDVHEVEHTLDALTEKNALKVLFALQELTVHDFDHFASISDIAKMAMVSESEAEEILVKLPVTVREDQDEESYRIDGGMAWLPSILLLMKF